MTATLSPHADEQVLRQCLERLVPEVFGTRSALAAVHRKRSQYSSFYGSDVITVRLAGGEEFLVFLKDFGSHQRVKEGMKERREREVVVYRDLLAGADLGTARYYGAFWDEPQGRFWLFLEYVPGVPVGHSEFEQWPLAAAWLGRKDAHFAPRAGRLEGCEILLRYDADFFQATAEQALRTAHQISPDFGDRLTPLVRRYPLAVRAMVSQPKTLVHGTYRPIQLILDSGPQPPRLCPVDWEKAGVGSCFFDLAFLTDGFQPPRLDRLFKAYRGEAARCGLEVCPPGEMKYLVDCHRLHRVWNWLAVCLDRKFPEHKITRLMGMAEQLGRLVLGE